MRTKILTGCLLLALVAGPALAAEQPLTGKRIDDFVASLLELDRLGDEFEDLETGPTGQPDSGELPASPLGAAVAAMQGHAAVDRIEAVVREHGFADLGEWGSMGDRIIRAVMALKMKDAEPEMDTAMKEAMERMKASGMSEAHMDAMKRSLAASRQTLKTMTDVPPADMAQVKLKLQDIEAGLERLD